MKFSDRAMRIYFVRSGGLAGIRMTTTIDSEMLSPEEVQKLREMLEAAGFFDLPPIIAPNAPGADRFQYELTVESEDRQHTVEIYESAIPAELRPVLEWLTQKAFMGK